MKLRLMVLSFMALVLPAAMMAKSHFVILGGLGGEPRYGKQWADYVDSLKESCAKAAGDESLVHALKAPAATREAIEALFKEVARQADESDIVAVFLIGHGSFDGYDYKFNIPGKDITATQIKELLDALPAKDQLIAVTTSSSGAAMEALKSDRRIVITATKSGAERTVTAFAEYWTEALKDPEADTNKDEVITAQEAFTFADTKVQESYKSEQKLATEHARIEGDLAANFTLARLGGAADALSDPKLRPLFEKRDDFERRIAELKGRKDEMEEAEYSSALQKLLIELARTQNEIDEAAGGQER